MAPAHSPIPATIPAARPAPADPEPILKSWLSSLNTALTTSPIPSLDSLFLPTSYWRDHLCLSWDFVTSEGPAKIQSLLSSQQIKSITLSDDHIPSVSPVDFEGSVPCVFAFVDIKTIHGTGQGVIRLLEDLEEGQGRWKAYTVYSALMELDAYPERVGKKRPAGVQHGADRGRKNWRERREDEKELKYREPVVLIVGAGQGGLVLAARLKMIGVDALVVDKNKRVGDNWRKRYHQLVLHDPVQYDHMPYLNFPQGWPTFTPKDKLADWFEFYASALELNIWTESSISASEFDEKTELWNVTITRQGSETRQLKPRHIVLATGHSGEPNMPDIDLSPFKGAFISHSSSFPGAKPDGKGKKAVVVGCCNSGHDIAQDYYEKGYEVTIVQRSSTYVMTSENGLGVLLAGLYDEDGPPVHDADLIFMSNPIPLFKRNQIKVTEEIARRDAHIITGLSSSGFVQDTGPNGSGFFMKYLERGGGYYLDVGASALISNGSIKLKRINNLVKVLPNGIQFDEASGILEADEVVFATGYANMTTTAKKILGEKVMEGVEDVWGIDQDTLEIRGMWREVRKGLWFMGGNLALTRWFSRMLALGIAAREAGLVKASTGAA